MTYLEAYRIWSSGDKSPEIYHTWAGLSTISSYISRRIWIDQGRDRTYANLYVLFVGPAGNGKSTAMKTAQKLVAHFKKQCPQAPESGTWQSLVKDLGDQKLHKRKFNHQGGKEVTYVHCSLFCDEFASLLQNDPGGWIKFLTRIYSCDDFDHKVKVAQEGEARHDTIENPYLVFLGCMTPDITKEIIREGIVSTGFNRRCIFVQSGFSGKCIPMRQLTDAQMQARDYCLKWAEQLVTQTGPFCFGPNAMEAYTEWYYQNHIRAMNETQSFMASWLECKDQIILRVAMLLEMGINLERKLSVKSIEEAIKLVDSTEANFHKIFTLSGRNPIHDIAQKIRLVVEGVKDPINVKQIYHQMRPDGTTQELQEAIRQLMEDGILQTHTTVQAGVQVTYLGTPEQLKTFLAPEHSADPPETAPQRGSNPFGFEAGPPE